jgi:hypothetical protein
VRQVGKRAAVSQPATPYVMDALERRRLAAEARVDDVLACVDQAHGLLREASNALASVFSMELASRGLNAQAERLQGIWRVVARRCDNLKQEGRLSLDYTPFYIPQETRDRSRRGRLDGKGELRANR